MRVLDDGATKSDDAAAFAAVRSDLLSLSLKKNHRVTTG